MPDVDAPATEEPVAPDMAPVKATAPLPVVTLTVLASVVAPSTPKAPLAVVYAPRSVVAPLYCWAPVVATCRRSMLAPSTLRLVRLVALPPSVTWPPVETMAASWPAPFSRPERLTSPLAVRVRLPPASVVLPVMSMAEPVRSPLRVTSPV